jgi:hypothetical protein
MQSKYVIKVQIVRSKTHAPRYHVNFPQPLAAAIGLQGGEEVQWELLNRGELRLVRPHAPPPSASQPFAKKHELTRHTVASAPDCRKRKPPVK